MTAGEQVYFMGAHLAHVVAYEERRRLAQLLAASRKAIGRGGARHRAFSGL